MKTGTREKAKKKKREQEGKKGTKGTNVRLVRFHDEINGMDLLKLTKLIYLHEVRFLVSRPSTGNSLGDKNFSLDCLSVHSFDEKFGYVFLHE